MVSAVTKEERDFFLDKEALEGEDDKDTGGDSDKENVPPGLADQKKDRITQSLEDHAAP